MRSVVVHRREYSVGRSIKKILFGDGFGNVPWRMYLPQDLEIEDIGSLGMLRMKAATLKACRVLSNVGDSLRIEQLCDTIERGEYQIDKEQVLNIISNELENPLESTKMKSFDSTPFAYSPVGQIHKFEFSRNKFGRMHVQLPNIKRSIEADVHTVIKIFQMSGLVFDEIDEHEYSCLIVEQVKRATDYSHQLDLMKKMSRFVSKSVLLESFKVPKPLSSFSSESLLSSEWSEGEPIGNIYTSLGEKERNQIGTNILRLYLLEVSQFHVLSINTSLQNLLLDQESGPEIVLSDYGTDSIEYRKHHCKHFMMLIEAVMSGDRTLFHEVGRKLKLFHSKTTSDEKQVVYELCEHIFQPFTTKDKLFDFDSCSLSLDAFSNSHHKPAMNSLPISMNLFLDRLLNVWNMLHTLQCSQIDCKQIIQQAIAEM